ncbi:MAG: ribbon-helix-helix protein, CopG family [Halovenus sp.]
MEELTFRLPAETKASLQAEATDRGVTLGEHLRDIIETYRGQTHQNRPSVDIEYAHSVDRPIATTDASHDGRSDSEEIGSFSYGSRSIFS